MRKLNVNSEQPFTGLLEQPIIMNFCYLAVTYLSISYPKSPSEGVPYIIANLLIAVLKDRDYSGRWVLRGWDSQVPVFLNLVYAENGNFT